MRQKKYLGTGLSHKNIFHFNDIDFEYLIFLFPHTYLRMIRGQNQTSSSHLISKTPPVGRNFSETIGAFVSSIVTSRTKLFMFMLHFENLCKAFISIQEFLYQ